MYRSFGESIVIRTLGLTEGKRVKLSSHDNAMAYVINSSLDIFKKKKINTNCEVDFTCGCKAITMNYIKYLRSVYLKSMIWHGRRVRGSAFF